MPHPEDAARAEFNPMPCVLVTANDGQPWLVATAENVLVYRCSLNGGPLDVVPASSDLDWQRTGAPSWCLDPSQVHVVDWPGGRYRFAIGPAHRLTRVDGPRDGDMVRAREDERDGSVVEGRLHLRHVPSLDYVQVLVHGTDGSRFVDPISIEIIEPGPPEMTGEDDDDPLRADPGWRRVIDMDDASAEGLVRTPRRRAGGSWAELFKRLDDVVRPFADAGWETIESHREESGEFGDSVAYDLRRGEEAIELELYEDGGLSVWDLGGDDDDGGEPMVSLAPDLNHEWARVFRERGWIDAHSFREPNA